MTLRNSYKKDSYKKMPVEHIEMDRMKYLLESGPVTFANGLDIVQ